MKKNTKKKFVVILLMGIIVLLISARYYMYSKEENINSANTTSKENNISNVQTKKEETTKTSDEKKKTTEEKEEKKENTEPKPLYEIVNNEEYELYGLDYQNDKKVLNKRNIQISFDYPLINLDTVEIGRINQEIKDYYDTMKKELNNLPAFDYDNHCVAIKKGDSYYGSHHIFSAKYDISKTDKYLSILVTGKNYTECASGGDSYRGYVINLENNKVMNNSEIAKLFNCSEQLIIDTYNNGADSMSISKVEDVQVYVYQNKLVMVQPGGSYDSLFQYDNGQFKEIAIK